jgi:hypothetical protein
MASLIWVPITTDLLGTICPKVPRGAMTGDSQTVSEFNTILGLDKTKATTVPISLSSPGDLALCTAAIANSHIPPADIAYYSAQLAQWVKAGITTAAQGAATALALGLTPVSL